MRTDHYARSGRRWALGAELVYRPIAAELKATAVPILGSRAGMTSAAHQTGLAEVRAEERPVDVGVTKPEQLVRYRFGHPIFADWLDAIGAARRCARRRRRAGDPRRHAAVPAHSRVPLRPGPS